MAEEGKSLDDITVAIAQWAANMLEAMQPFLEAAVGYRAAAIAGGFEPDCADQLAVDWHHAAVEIVIHNLKGATS